MIQTITSISSNLQLDYKDNYSITLAPGEFVSAPRFRLDKEGKYEDAHIDIEIDGIARGVYLYGQDIELSLYTEEGLYGVVKGRVVEISEYGLEVEIYTFTQTTIVSGDKEYIVFDIPNNSLKINGVERLQKQTSEIFKENENGTT